jgi:16S rRNA (uracil1498-N3)-methyltransferase
MSQRKRFYLPGGPRGEEAVLAGEELGHLSRVLRLAPGDEVVLFDGRGGEWLARLSSLNKREARLAVVCPLSGGAERRLSLHLAQALIKGPKADWLVGKACELGIAKLTFFPSERSVPRADTSRLERWRRLAAESLKQCRGSLLPEIQEAKDLGFVLSASGAGLRLILHAGEGVRGLREVLEGAPGFESATLLVGPEGGFTDMEVENGVAAGFVPVGLGGRILRAETAAVCGAAVLLYRAGEFG